MCSRLCCFKQRPKPLVHDQSVQLHPIPYAARGDKDWRRSVSHLLFKRSIVRSIGVAAATAADGARVGPAAATPIASAAVAAAALRPAAPVLLKRKLLSAQLLLAFWSVRPALASAIAL